MIVISADIILLNFTQQEPDNISAIDQNKPVKTGQFKKNQSLTKLYFTISFLNWYIPYSEFSDDKDKITSLCFHILLNNNSLVKCSFSRYNLEEIQSRNKAGNIELMICILKCFFAYFLS